MARRRKGSLSDEDRTLWAHVARQVTPITPAARRRAAAAVETPPETPEKPAARSQQANLPAMRSASMMPVALPAGSRLGSKALPRVRADLAPTPAERLAAQPLRMDPGAHKKLTRGKLRPEARIDLHGLTLNDAKAELTGFLLSARASGRRLVLVITGKGKGDHGPLPFRSGALRHEVPHWLHMAPLATVVAQVVPAHLRHGGEGAYYVWLRRMPGAY